MGNADYFDGLEGIYYKYATGWKLMREFCEESDFDHGGIPGGMYYSQFARLSVYLENKHRINNVKLIQTIHIYELLEYMRSLGFAESTLKGYLTACRQVYRLNQHLFSEEFVLPTNAAYEQYRQEHKI